MKNKTAKRKAWFVNFTAFFLFLTILFIFFKLYKPETVVVKTAALNVRSGPGLQYEIQSQLTAGSQVVVLEKKNKWYKIKLPDKQQGWIASWLLSNENSHTKMNLAAFTKQTAYLKADPKDSAEELKKLKKNTEILVIGEQKNWYQVSCHSQEGWLPKSVIQLAAADKNQKNLLPQQLYAAQNDTKIRQSPSIEAPILEILQHGEEMTYLATDNDWFKVKTANGQIGYIASWVVDFKDSKQNITSLAEATILLDPGHGGSDPGAHTNDEKVHEKELTLQTALFVKKELEKTGAHVLMTRDKDQFVTLSQIALKSNFENVDAFISFHYDSSEKKNSATGTTTYFYTEQDRKLAETINQQLADKLPLPNRGIEIGNFQVLRDNQQPALLLELGYINNDLDASYIRTKTYQKQIAKAIVKGLTEYFSS